MRTQRFVHRLICAVVIAGLLLGSLAPLAQAQDGPRFLPLVQHPGVIATPQQPDAPGLFRTVVDVQSAAQWRDLERMQPVFLDRGDDWAWLLVDDVQLADLARLRYNPDQTNSLGTLLALQDAAVRSVFEPLMAQTQALATQVAVRPESDSAGDTEDAAAAGAARAELRAAMHALAAEQRALLATVATVDGDADGATDDQESWWCTDPTNPDTDFDGASDGAELAALREWANNSTRDRLHAGPPVTGQPFIGWPPDNPGCLDNDRDSIPNLAELYFLGFNMAAESTDRDQFDDGQELFGTTNCPGSGTGCGYGSLPPASTDPGVVLFPEMPGWVRAPGNHPLVAGLPVVEIDIVPSSLNVKTVTTITTDKTISQGTEKSYSTATTEGTSTSVSDTETWNNWVETSISTPQVSSASTVQNTDVAGEGYNQTALFQEDKYITDTEMLACAAGIAGTVFSSGLSPLVGCIPVAWKGIKAGVDYLSSAFAPPISEPIDLSSVDWEKTDLRLDGIDLGQGRCAVDVSSGGTYTCKSVAEGLTHPGDTQLLNVTGLPGKLNSEGKLDIADTGDGFEGEVKLISKPPQAGQPFLLTRQPIFNLSYPAPRPVPIRTDSNGRSWGGSRTVGHSEYKEQTVTNGEAFSTVEAWSTATAVNSAHAADLRFSYMLTNRGDDFARKICDIAFNVYIGDDAAPAATYDLGPDLGGDGCLHNFRPDGAPIQRTVKPLPLSLDQLRAIDTGAPIRVVLSRYVLSTEDYYAADAVARGLTIALEDGTDDGDETIDTYLIPTWKSGETVLQVLGRYFPHEAPNGTLTAIWTPEYRSDTPAWCIEPKRPIDQPTKAVWCKHELSVADWWNVYTDGLGDGSQGFQDTPAVPGAVALFRFNQDSDHDGFSDRSEAQLGTDPDDASSFPQPEVLAGVHSIRSGNQVRATLSLLNTGFYDAYGVEAVMVAPDNSVSITNNTVGGSGRVRALQQVIVGSRVLLSTPLPAPWSQDGHAAPAAGGYYTGSADRTYTFTVANCPSGGCQVGSGSWTLNWSDGAGGSGSLAFGDGYASPTFRPVSSGLTVALYSGSVQNGESFTVSAQTPRDTFQYTINREPYTAPLVIVSYNDPQGNHRFVVPTQAMALTSPTDNLQVYAGQMLYDVGVEVVSRAPFAPGSNTLDLLVNNPSNTALAGARLFLEVVNIDGAVVSEVSTQVDVPPGPKTVAMTFSTGSFTPAYVAGQDYILLAFLTDSQGNILDTAGRPLSSLQADPQPNLESANTTWDIGYMPQGSLLRHPLALANTGSGRLYLYLPPAPGLSLVRHSDTVGAADLSDYSLLLHTAELPVGPVAQTFTLRTSDPNRPTLQVRVEGIISPPIDDTPGGALVRPLDVPVTVQGPKSQGEWVTFNHTLGPDPQSLHPVKVYNADYSSFKGAGKYATAFSAGTASYDMFGDGRDGDLLVTSGQTVTINDVRVSVSASGTTASPANSNGFAAGDLVMFHQTQGTANVGKWELATIATINSPNSWMLTRPLSHIYDTAGGRAQAIKVMQYRNVTVQGNGNLTAPAWNGTAGGILVFLANENFINSGSIFVTGQGYRLGGKGRQGGTSPVIKQTGEGSLGYITTTDTGGCSNGNTQSYGSGGGYGADCANQAGGGGGHKLNGQNGQAIYNNIISNNGGGGGISTGSDDFSSIIFGGQGGGGGSSYGAAGGNGGAGGGIIYIAANSTMNSGSIASNGIGGQDGNMVNGWAQAGGGGAGGSVFLISTRADIGISLVSAVGGNGGVGVSNIESKPHGGNGSIGRIRVEYCDSLSGSTTPPASTQKLTCYITEQVESSPYTTGRLNLPENVSGSATYQVQYGRKLGFAAAGDQPTTLRLPAAMLAAASLDLLVSGVGSGDLTLKLDIGADGSWEVNQTQAVTDAGTFPVTNLAAALNAYWQSQGAPVSGSLDVPIKVSLSKPGQVLLTNLQLNIAGSKVRYLRLPVRNYTQFNLALQVGGSASTPLTVAVDIGDNGTLDWSDTRTADLPLRLLTGDLSAALNTYLDAYRDYGSYGDEIEVRVRIHIVPDQPVRLLDYSAASEPVVDLVVQPPQVSGPALAAVADTAAGPGYKEGETLQVQATVHNAGTRPSGPVTVAFFATAAGWGDWYIGSAFVPTLGQGSSAQVSTSWNTLGFSGPTQVKAVINPYGRTGETRFDNNTGLFAVNIVPLAQPPTAAFSASPTGGSVGVNVKFTDASTSPLPITAWLWDFGDGKTSTQQHPTHIYNQAGVYTVRLTVSNASSSDEEVKTGFITVTAPPAGVIADFSATPTSGIVPLVVVFQDLSSGPVTSWQWDFGDKNTSSERNPQHTYTMPGVYTVKLTVGGASGSNSKTRTGYITVNPKQAQTITFDPLPKRTLGDPPFALSATASSGLPVSFSSSTPAVCMVNGSTVTLQDTGMCGIIASQAGDGSYAPALAVLQTFIVQGTGQNPQTITFDPLRGRRLAESPFTVSASASSQLPVSFYSTTPAVCTVAASSVTLVSVGTCTVVAFQPGNATYQAAEPVARSFAVTQGEPSGPQPQTITMAALPDRRLDQSPFTLQATASSGLPVSFGSDTPAICTVDGVTMLLLAVGECRITATQAGNAGYLPAEAVTATFRVLSAAGALPYRIFLPEVFQ